MVSEAYTSRYKGILGRNSFKHVVQTYRKRTKVELREKVQRIDTSTGVKFVLRSTVREETDVVEEQSPTTDALTSQTDSQVHHAQRSLDQLPQQILTEARSIQQYMDLVGGFEEHSVDTERFVNGTIWNLVDDVMGGRKLAKYTKMDILKDGESRQVRGLGFIAFSGWADFFFMGHRR